MKKARKIAMLLCLVLLISWATPACTQPNQDSVPTPEQTTPTEVAPNQTTPAQTTSDASASEVTTLFEDVSTPEENITATTSTEITTSEETTPEETPHEHVFENGVVTKEPPICGGAGELTETCTCGATKVTQIHTPVEHSFGGETVVKEPTCNQYGEGRITCLACGQTQSTLIPKKNEHNYQGDICVWCGKKDIPLYPVLSAYDADGDGEKDVYEFSPKLPLAYANLLHVWAGDYDRTLSSSTVSSASTNGLMHWYIPETSTQYLVYKVEAPETGAYEMIVHVRMKDAQERGTKYTVNEGTDYEQVFQASYGYEGMDFEQLRDEATVSSYMYGIVINLVEGENTIKIEHAPSSPKSQHYRDFYFIKVGEFHEHDYATETTITEPTCNKSGKKTLTCSCGKVKDVVIPATGEHNYESESVVVSPTCGESGTKKLSCACGESKIEYVPATGEHNYQNDFCTVCGQKDYSYLSEPLLCGDALSSYVIVYDEHASDYTVRAAEYIAEQIAKRTGIVLSVFPIDWSDAVREHEIVVGETDRAISKTLNATTEGLEFALFADNDHIALEGDYFIIAAAAYYFVETYIPGALFETDVPKTTTICTPIVEEAENFILLIGDGMGPNQTKLFDAYKNGNLADYSDGEDFFYGYLLPYYGEAKTNSLSGTTDSAAAGTALSSGYKTVNAYVGKDGNQKDVASLTELAASKGKATAVMSTEAQTGATPSAFSAHANDRHDTDVILASQAALIEKYGTIINCDYNVYTEAEMVALRAAIRNTLSALSQDEDGFFMMYEEAYIDKHSHNNRAAEAYLAMVRFNQAIALFMEYAFYNPNTVVIITADHETGGLQIAANGNFYYTSGAHTSTNVPVFAYGAGTEVFDGQTIENIQIPKTIAAMFGVEIEGTNPVQYPALVPVK